MSTISSYTSQGSLPAIQSEEVVSAHQSSRGCPLDRVNVLVITSGHEATDHRVYAKHACSLADLGANVTIVAGSKDDTVAKVPVIAVRRPRSRLTRFLWQPWRCLWAARRLDADIIHFHDAEMLMTLPMAKLWWRGTKFVYDVHEDFANLMLVRDWLPAWAKPVVRILTNTLEKGLALLADGIVGVTPPLADKFYNKARVVGYNYVSRKFFDDAAKMSREARNREFDLVHLGTLNLRRAEFLAATIRQFHQLRLGTKSLIVGISPEIEKFLRELIPAECVLLGKVRHEEMPRLLGNAKVGLDVHPWLGPHLLVALPVKVCEYMATGCAVVSSSMPVLDRLLSEMNVDSRDIKIIKGGTPTEYAKAAAELVEDIEKGADPGLNLRELALQHMIWEREAAKIVQLYLRLMGRPCAI